jgi:hypothetical protein
MGVIRLVPRASSSNKLLHVALLFGNEYLYFAQGDSRADAYQRLGGNAENQGLVNSRFLYVGVSRARSEAEIFTEDVSGLASAVARQVSKTSAVEAFEQGTDLEVALHDS